MCNCITEIEQRNTTESKKVILDTVLLLSGVVIPKLGAYISYKKKDGTYGKQRLTCVFPTYCPWCGVKYETGEAIANGESL